MTQELDIKDIYNIIKKRIWWIVSLVIVACATTAVISYVYIQPIYEASTKLIVNRSVQSLGEQQLSLNDINFNIRLIDTYKEIIKTPAIMDKVAAEHPEFNLTVEQLISKVNVRTVNNSQVMTLSVTDPSYRKATQVVNAISEVFVREIPLIMSVDNISILSKANGQRDPSPVKPNPLLNIAISFVLALMIGVGVAFLIEYLDDTIKTEDDINTYLGLPNLISIRKLKDEDVQERTSNVYKSRNKEGAYVSNNQ